MVSVVTQLPPATVEEKTQLARVPGVRSRYDNRITLQKLEIFCAVIELGGVSRAAEHLWVAQPVISAHIQSLQKRLGVKLLYRDGQRMRLTDAGDQVYRWATETLSGTRELMRALDGLHEGARGAVAVAASMSVGSYVLPPILAEFRNQRPKSEITLVVSDPGQACSAVETGECDFGMIVADAWQEHPNLRSDVIGSEPIVLVAAPDFMSDTHTLPLAALAEVPLISSPSDNVRRELVDRQLRSHGVSPRNVVMELGHPEAMKRVTQDGLGISLLFRSSVKQELRRGTLREISIEDADLQVPLITVVRADKRLSPIQEQLIEDIRRHIAEG